MNIVRIMKPAVNTVSLRSSHTVRQGLEIMRRQGYTAIPVQDDEGVYVGCITEGDFLWFLLKERVADLRELEKYPVADLVRKDFCPALSITAGEDEIIELITHQNFLPVVDDRGCLCGLVTRGAVMEFLSNRVKDGK